ncbi:hypothetical protein [Streptomyces sp. ISL-98]|nr:hypothetical protein [Streptomyces sp. ISL-98]
MPARRGGEALAADRVAVGRYGIAADVRARPRETGLIRRDKL